MNASKSMLELENASEGRFLSGTRYWFGYCVVGLTYIAGSAGIGLDLPFWARAAVAAAMFFAYTAIFSKFKKRAIR